MKMKGAPLLILGAPLILMCCAGKPDGISRRPTSQLSPCPASPNCVATTAQKPSQRMQPLAYRGGREDSLDLIVNVLEAMPRSKIVTRTENYIHAEFRSRLFGFVDDVEFVFDDETARIHYRSASRTGYSDMGVNRKRMHAIGEAYGKAPVQKTEPGEENQRQ